MTKRDNLIQSGIPVLTEEKLNAIAEIVSTWHIYNYPVETPRDVAMEIWSEIFSDESPSAANRSLFKLMEKNHV